MQPYNISIIYALLILLILTIQLVKLIGNKIIHTLIIITNIIKVSNYYKKFDNINKKK